MIWKARYTVLTVLFFGWLVAYMDRMVISVAMPYIAKDLNLGPLEMGTVLSAFFLGYALCQIPGGMLADKFGSRKLMTVALIWWSAFTAFTGWVGSLTSILIIRLVFGMGEGFYPGGYFKSLAQWFPPKERATANGLAVSSNLLGPAIAPLVVVGLMGHFGWRTVFYLMFIPGIIMAIVIFIYVKDSPDESSRVSPQELDEIKEDEANIQALGGEKVTFLNLIKLPILWQLFLTVFLFSITSLGFLMWLPTYLVKVRGFALLKMGIAASLPFFAGTIAMAIGGYISDKKFSRHRRLLFILSELLGGFFLYMTYTVESADTAVVYNTLVGFWLAFAFAVFWGFPLTILPKEVMGASAATVNFAAQAAGFISPTVIGYLVKRSAGGFDSAFTFLIAGAVGSVLTILTIRKSALKK
jgi:sugar phosphate permease